MHKNILISRILVLLTVITLVVPAWSVRHARADEDITGVVTASELYMRTGPGTSYDKVTVGGSPVILVYGQEVTVLSVKDGWYHIRAIFNGRLAEGYSLGSSAAGVPYITVESGADVETEKRIGRVTAVELNVRSGPSTDYAIVKAGGTNVVLKKGMEVNILGETDGWYHIQVQYNSVTAEGYCLGKYIEAEEETQLQTPTYAYGRVTATALNVRTGPSTSYSKLTKGGEAVVFKLDQQVTILGETDGWYHITADYNGSIVEGYCLGSYIQVTEGTPAQEDASGSTTGSGGTTDSGSTSGSGSTEGSDTADDGPYVPTSPTDLSHGVPEGYKLETRTFVATLDYSGTVTAQDGLNMRKATSADGDIITVLPYGTQLTIIYAVIRNTTAKDGSTVSTRWYKVIVDVDGEYVVGFVVADYIELDCSGGILAKTKYGSQKLLKKIGKTGVVRNSSDTIVKLAKGTELTITGEATSSDGTKYYHVTAEYKGETVTGYIKTMRVTYITTVSEYSVGYLIEDPDYKAAGDSETGDDTTEGSGSADTKYAFDGANALILDASGLTVHTEASNSSAILYTGDDKAVMLYTGDSVEIIDVTTQDDYIWCYVRLIFNGDQYYGYIRSTHIESESELLLMSTNTAASTAALDFESKLEKEGFPESYRVALRALHEKYPAWEFKAYHTGLEWSEVIAGETVVGENLIPNTKGVEWKSLAAGAYSWKTDTFVAFDGSTWVTASEKAVCYYMDPRNFLEENTIFQFEVLSYSPSYQDVSGVATILKNTALSNTSYTYKDELGIQRSISYEDTFMMAAEYTGVSPYHLASRVKQEVTIGTNSLSNSVTGTVSGYEGLFNFYNIGAYNSTEAGGAIRNGLKFAKNGSTSVSLNKSCMISWTNPFRAILGGAFYIGNNYVNRGQNTIYLQKFNVTTEYGNTYGHQYMANVEAPYSEGIRVYRGYEELETTPVVFSIPVYLNMPEEACGIPEPEGNPNNWLKTLKVVDTDGNKLALTPTFDYTADQEYSLIIDSSVDYLKIKTTTVSTLANVTSAKSVYPEYGLNRVVVTVEAENGDVREYVINVYREEPEDTGETTGEGTGEGSDTAAGNDAPGTDITGTDTTGTDTIGTDATGTDATGTETTATDAAGADAAGTGGDTTETDTGSTATGDSTDATAAGSDAAGTDTTGTDATDSTTAEGSDVTESNASGDSTDATAAGSDATGSDTTGTDTTGTDTGSTDLSSVIDELWPE